MGQHRAQHKRKITGGNGQQKNIDDKIKNQKN
jgi:hypothetical protein